LCFALSSTSIASAQISVQEQQQIEAQIKSVLPGKWKVTGRRENSIPFGWSGNTFDSNDSPERGFRITVENSGSVRTSSGEKSGGRQVTKSHPTVTIWFIPLSNGLTLEQAKNRARGDMAAQMAIAAVVGTNDRYLLAASSNSDEVLKRIIKKFQVKTTRWT
jgi:hypothetical protein